MLWDLGTAVCRNGETWGKAWGLSAVGVQQEGRQRTVSENPKAGVELQSVAVGKKHF